MTILQKEQLEKEAMKMILSGRIDNPYTKDADRVARKIRKLKKENKKIPMELEEEYNALSDLESNWKL